MIKKNTIYIIMIVIISLFSIVILSERNIVIEISNETIQTQTHIYKDNISINNISYKVGEKENNTGVPKAVISAFSNDALKWEYYNETYQYSQLRKIKYLNDTLYAVGSEYNNQYGTEKIMILSLNASTGTLNWKYYNDSFKFSRLNTLTIYNNTLYCGGYESNNALIMSLTLNGTLKGKNIVNNSNMSEIKEITFKNNELCCEAKLWNNKSINLALPITQINF